MKKPPTPIASKAAPLPQSSSDEKSTAPRESKTPEVEVTPSGMVIIDPSRAIQAIRDNGTMDAVKKYMKPRFKR